MTENAVHGQTPAIETEAELAKLGEATTFGLNRRTVQIVFLIGIAFSAWQIYTAAYAPFSSQVMRSVHVGFLMLMAFLVYRVTRDHTRANVPWYDWLLAGAGFLLAFYHWIFEIQLIQTSGDPSLIDLIVGAVVVLILFEAARRIMGYALPLICLSFIVYALIGRSLPAPFGHRGYDIPHILERLFLGTEGIYGIPTLVSSTYIFLFILFGTFLEKAGMINLFNDIAMGTVGHTRGGPAKVAVFSSGMMGTINGSGVANVVTIGQFTIPLMKRFGYRAEFAGAVEATASMGGQIMPPVMGAVAFIMAETINVPYIDICIAAAIPAFLYYLTVFWMVHLEAGKHDLRGIPKDQRPDPIAALKRQWYLIIPLVGLVWLLVAGYTPLFAGTVGLALTAIFILGQTAVGMAKPMVARLFTWVVLGVAAAALFNYMNFNGLAIVIGLLIVACFIARGGKDTLRICLAALSDGARAALPVGVACALVGVIIGMMSLTGLDARFARIILDWADGSLFLTLFFTMIVCLILGMGVPTIPNYIITSTMAAPILFKMGVPLIVSHMFVFYFGIMADLTPPVALAAMAAASIAKANFMRIGLIATRIAIAGYVVPYMAVYDPALMFQTGTVLDTAYVTLKAVIGIVLWGTTVTGYFLAPINVVERIFAFAAAAFLVVAVSWSDYVGFAASAAFMLWHWARVHGLPLRRAARG